MLKDLAKIIADFAGKEVVFELPDETEKAGYSKATKARLDGSKLKKLGWTARYDIKQAKLIIQLLLRESGAFFLICANEANKAFFEFLKAIVREKIAEGYN